ncbi:amidohydrolase family protein, partial [Bacillus velezensis]
EERVTVAEAVHAYTVGSAYASHQEHEKGRLVPGMLADFAVLSDDIHTVDPATIRDLRVTATVVGGEVVHGSV